MLLDVDHLRLPLGLVLLWWRAAVDWYRLISTSIRKKGRGRRRTVPLPAVVLVHAVSRGVVRLPGWRRSAMVALPKVLMSFLHNVRRGCSGVQILLL